MSGPNSNPELGQQNYRTPKAFLDAALRRLGKERFVWDLACSEHDCVGAEGGFTYPAIDALKEDWRFLREAFPDEVSFCNPPFAQSKDFARKAAESNIPCALLVPVALGTRWWREYVHRKAEVLGVGRLVFNNPDGTPVLGKNGKPQGINRDCCLLVYGMGAHTAEGHYPLEDWQKWLAK